MAAFLLGALFFFKYAADNAWIGPTGRVAIGAATGVLILVVAEAIRGRTRRRFVHALIGVGLATLFVAVWASLGQDGSGWSVQMQRFEGAGLEPPPYIVESDILESDILENDIAPNDAAPSSSLRARSYSAARSISPARRSTC